MLSYFHIAMSVGVVFVFTSTSMLVRLHSYFLLTFLGDKSFTENFTFSWVLQPFFPLFHNNSLSIDAGIMF